MTIHKHTGGCHCHNVSFEIDSTNPLNSYQPRACDCNFCTKHGASYISDKNGKLTIQVKDERDLSKYQHGNKIASFLICRVCGVLIGVCYKDQDGLYVTVNSKAVDDTSFGEEIVVSPKMLSEKEKIQKWKNVWFTDTNIEGASIASRPKEIL